jgi:hypothetical protein
MDEGRDPATGRFKKGFKGGPGRPKLAGARELAYLKVLQNVASPAEWRKICEKAVADAKAGSSRARDWISRYVCPEDPAELLTVISEIRAELEALKRAPQIDNHESA